MKKTFPHLYSKKARLALIKAISFSYLKLELSLELEYPETKYANIVNP